MVGLGAALATTGQSAPDDSRDAGARAQAAARGERPRPAIVWAVGDGADGGRRAKRLARVIASERPDAFLYLGDVYERGTAREFRRRYHRVYGALARVTAPTPGNHECGRRREGYYPYWRSRKGRPQPPWYAFRLAGWDILSLNSQAAHGPGSAQLRWLRAELRESGTCRLAFWHRPRFSAGAVHGDQRDVAPLWNALRGHAALVLGAHDHNLQRLDPRDGLTELIAGAGGHSRYPLKPRDPRLAFGRDDVDGALRLELEPGRARWNFRSAGGRELDAGELRCEARLP